MKCLEPATLGRIELRNRIIYPPMVTGFASEDGFVTDRLIAYAVERARGGVGLYTLEATCVDPQGLGFAHGVRIDEDNRIPGLARLTEAVHAAGGKISVQLHHAGRETSRAITGQVIVAPSDCPVSYSNEPVHVLDSEEIRAIIRRFADAARRAKSAGFDAVEIHGAHGYLLSQFLSPYTNRRTDEYGGSLENRTRFCREIIRAVREATGDDFTVTLRLSVEESHPGGLSLQDGAAAAAIFSRCGIDAIHIVSGNYATPNTVIPPATEGRIINLARAVAVRQAVGPDFPLILAGRIKTAFQAEDIIQNGIADFVAMGRALIADPELPLLSAAGKFSAVRPCLGCNDGCALRTGQGLDTLCAINPFMGHEMECSPSEPAARPGNVLVIGGGPAGMEAAWYAARRGHHVTLCEKDARLGGQFFLASQPPLKTDIAIYLFHMERRLKDAGVDIRLNCPVDADFVRNFGADHVLVATGSLPVFLPFPGLEDTPHFFANDILRDSLEKLGRRVVVIGGGLVGAETAEEIARTGRHVDIVEMTGDIARDMYLPMRESLKDRLSALGVTIRTNCKVQSLSKGRVTMLDDKGNVSVTDPFDSVVLALGARADQTLKKALDEAGIRCTAIGDCVHAGKILQATGDAMRAVQAI